MTVVDGSTPAIVAGELIASALPVVGVYTTLPDGGVRSWTVPPEPATVIAFRSEQSVAGGPHAFAPTIESSSRVGVIVAAEACAVKTSRAATGAPSQTRFTASA